MSPRVMVTLHSEPSPLPPLVQAVPLPVAAAENRNNHVKPSRCMLKSSLCSASSIRPWHYFLLVAIKVMCL